MRRAKNAKKTKIKNFHDLRCLRVLRAKPAVSFPKQPQQQRQNCAQDQAGNDGKMKTETVLGIMDVAGQTPEPAFAEARPQERPHRRQQQPGNHQIFAQVVHNSKMAREAREGNKGFF